MRRGTSTPNTTVSTVSAARKRSPQVTDVAGMVSRPATAVVTSAGTAARNQNQDGTRIATPTSTHAAL